ncbi:MAG: hypothetical protein EHM91_10825 [Planctomycetota bacterium]|nr:MAG: hypothetical protein EHM91_10825 [Planctomycetota bacterium]
MRRLIALVLSLSAAGCVAFDAPTDERLRGIRLDSEEPGPSAARCRFRMSVEHPSLAGEYDGVVVAHRSRTNPVLRAQLFGDLGPRFADVMARPDRIVGYFPQTREGVDCALPREASPHLLLFLGASLVEEFLTRADRSRVIGVRTEGEETWLRLRPAIPGTECHLSLDVEGKAKKRKFSWMTGVSWQEEWSTPDECRITAPNLSIRVKILERMPQPLTTLVTLDLQLPEDVRIVVGSRK